MDHHVAQVNVARLRAPIDSPELADFVALLDTINELGDTSPGFVWRLKTPGGDATSFRVFDDDSLIVNLTVWESIEALSDFAYRTDHKEVMRRRREWFVPMEEAYLALWWVPIGHRPSVAEAEDRLRYLRAQGPTPEAFTFRDRFPPRDTFNYLTQSSKSA
jgi:heme-degrading monooxygenase HmoA